MANETNSVDGIAISTEISDVAVAREVFSLSDSRSVAAQLEGKKISDAMEGVPSDFQMIVAGVEQIKESTQLKEYVEDTEKHGNDSISKDKDGDGIPDDYDKNPGRSTADVAAEKYGIGKYKRAKKMEATLSALKNILKNVKGLLNALPLFVLRMSKNWSSKNEDKDGDEEEKIISIMKGERDE